MAKDPIVEETRSIREDLAKAHDYDVHQIARALQLEEAKGDRQVVTLAAKRIPPSRRTGKRDSGRAATGAGRASRMAAAVGLFQAKC